MRKSKQQKIGCPFIGPDGLVKSPFRAILDRCIIWPTPAPEKIGLGTILIPDTIRMGFQDSTGILLSVGPGYYDKRGRWCPTSDQLKPGIKIHYDRSVPWGAQGTGLDGKMYNLVICGVKDVQGIIE